MQKDRDMARRYREAAYEGDVMAMNNLGVCYHTGKGVVEDHAMAFQWYMKAAELGDTYACYNVAECYYKGDGVEQSDEKANEWYLKAANKGDMQSQVNLANAYYLGKGIEKDHEKSQQVVDGSRLAGACAKHEKPRCRLLERRRLAKGRGRSCLLVRISRK